MTPRQPSAVKTRQHPARRTSASPSSEERAPTAVCGLTAAVLVGGGQRLRRGRPSGLRRALPITSSRTCSSNGLRRYASAPVCRARSRVAASSWAVMKMMGIGRGPPPSAPGGRTHSSRPGECREPDTRCGPPATTRGPRGRTRTSRRCSPPTPRVAGVRGGRTGRRRRWRSRGMVGNLTSRHLR